MNYKPTFSSQEQVKDGSVLKQGNNLQGLLFLNLLKFSFLLPQILLFQPKSGKTAQDCTELMNTVHTAQQCQGSALEPHKHGSCGDGMRQQWDWRLLQKPHFHMRHPLRNYCEVQTLLGLGSRWQLLLHLTVVMTG